MEKKIPLKSTAERVGIEKGMAEALAKARESLLVGIQAVLDVKSAAPGAAT
jgi:hypothetical protein